MADNDAQVFSAPGEQPRKAKSGLNMRVVMMFVALAIAAMLIAAGLRSRSKPQALTNVEPSVAALAKETKAAAAKPAAAPASAAPAPSPNVIALPKPAPQAVAATIPEVTEAVPLVMAEPQGMSVDARFAQLEERLNSALRELNTSRADVRALEQRVARLEGELKQANERAQQAAALSEKVKAEAAKEKTAQAARSDAAAATDTPKAEQAQPKRVAAAKRRRVQRSDKAAAKGSAAAVAVSERSRQQQRAPQGQGALLAVDMWDGKPSAVIGTGIPGDRRVRVLQPGEQLAGVALVKADARRGSATFSTGTGVFTMFVDE